jgi:hypothetical protein
MILIRLILLPFKIVLALLGITVKTGYKAGKLPVKASTVGMRVLGFRGWLFFLVGLAVGLLFAPGPGKELRDRLAEVFGGGTEPDTDLAEKVVFELAHAPRTWHLPQPAVSVVAGRVTLRGTVPAEETRDELVRVAGAIPGVTAVDSQLEVIGTVDAVQPVGV